MTIVAWSAANIFCRSSTCASNLHMRVGDELNYKLDPLQLSHQLSNYLSEAAGNARTNASQNAAASRYVYNGKGVARSSAPRILSPPAREVCLQSSCPCFVP